MRAYFFCVIFTQLFGNSNYYPYFCVKITHKMKDLKYYKEIFCSSELELYFMEENGSCSFLVRNNISRNKANRLVNFTTLLEKGLLFHPEVYS